MIGETAATAMRRLSPTSTMPASTTMRPRQGAGGGMRDCTDGTPDPGGCGGRNHPLRGSGVCPTAGVDCTACLGTEPNRMVRRTGLIDTAVDELRGRIETEQWPVGTRIPPEPALVDLLGVGRNTVREAVQSLVHAGLLERRQGSGTYVLSRSELAVTMGRQIADARQRDVVEVRRALEVEAARLAARRRTATDAAALLQRRDERAAAYHAGDLDGDGRHRPRPAPRDRPRRRATPCWSRSTRTCSTPSARTSGSTSSPTRTATTRTTAWSRPSSRATTAGPPTRPPGTCPHCWASETTAGSVVHRIDPRVGERPA